MAVEVVEYGMTGNVVVATFDSLKEADEDAQRRAAERRASHDATGRHPDGRIVLAFGTKEI